KPRAILLPWAAVVLGSATPAAGQVTVVDDPGPGTPNPSTTTTQRDNPLRSAVRDGRSINISSADDSDLRRPLVTPEFHTVSRGDTLWDITGYYFSNPWRWPRVWGMNPQITNPHWIYPGDRVRLLEPGQAQTDPAEAPTRSTQTISNAPLRSPSR